MQVICNEKLETTIFPVIIEYYKSKRELCEKGKNMMKKNGNVNQYELHYGKLLYILTQHSYWNRKHNPYLLCTCSRGEAVQNLAKGKQHVCKRVSHHQRLHKTTHSKNYWEANMRLMIANPDKFVYTVKDYRDWCDEHKDGISHFGIHPNLLPLEEIRLDVFHLCCAIARCLLDYYLRILVSKHLKRFPDKLFELMKKNKFGNFHVVVFQTNESFNKF